MSAVLLRLKTVQCAACPVRSEARAPVPSEGPAEARIVLLGRNPGRDEDRCGRPFVGRSGGLLDRALVSLGVDRRSMVVTNAVKCFTTDNRAPRADEYTTCMAQHLVHELLWYRPALVVTFGADVFARLVNSNQTLTSARQKLWPLPSIEAVVAPMLHPSAILRDPSKMTAWLSDWAWLSRQPVWMASAVPAMCA